MFFNIYVNNSCVESIFIEDAGSWSAYDYKFDLYKRYEDQYPYDLIKIKLEDEPQC